MQSDLIPEDHGRPTRLGASLVCPGGTRPGSGRHSAACCLYEGVLYVQTNTATFTPSTRRRARRCGRSRSACPNHPSMPPDAKGDMLAVVNGSRLYVVNRFNGDLLYEKAIKDAPGGGPALSSKRVYVPSVTGLIIAYHVEAADNDERSRWTKPRANRPSPPSRRPKRLAGRTFASTRRRRAGVLPIVWAGAGAAAGDARRSGRGVRGLADRPRISEPRPHQPRGRETRWRSSTAWRPARRSSPGPPICRPIPRRSATPAWSSPPRATDSCTPFKKRPARRCGDSPTGEPIVESPAVIDDRVYVTTQLGGMYSPRHQNRQESLVDGGRDAVRRRQQDAGVRRRPHRAVSWCSAPPAAPGSTPSPPRAFPPSWRIPTPIAST